MEARASAGPIRSLDAGKLLAALGAITLLVGLFLDWFELDLGGPPRGASAWTVFEIVDVLLAALAIATLLGAANALVRHARLPSLPEAAIPAAGVAALVLVTVSLVNNPPAASDADPAEGAWISFAGSLLMALGAFLGSTRISLVVSPRESASPATPPQAPRARPEDETEILRGP